MGDDYTYDLFWHALNYRTAGQKEAEAMWQELQACSKRIACYELESALAKSASREAALVEKLNDAYEEGWHACACWADRDDLHCDTSSKAYTEERDERLAKIKEAS